MCVGGGGVRKINIFGGYEEIVDIFCGVITKIGLFCFFITPCSGIMFIFEHTFSFFLIILARSNFDHYARECEFGILKKKNSSTVMKTITTRVSNSSNLELVLRLVGPKLVHNVCKDYQQTKMSA